MQLDDIEANIREIREGRTSAGLNPYHCEFSITTPKYYDTFRELEETDIIKEVYGILDRNNVKHHFCDTLPGSYDLNRNWVTTDIVDCFVEYSGVYPINWNTKDVARLKQMDYNGEVIISVAWYDENNTFICLNQ